MNNLPVRQILFPEDFPDTQIEPIQEPGILRIGHAICARIGREILGLPANAVCGLNAKRGQVYFYYHEHTPRWREVKVPVRDVHDAIVHFLIVRAEQAGAVVERVDWTGFRLDVRLRPKTSQLFAENLAGR